MQKDKIRSFIAVELNESDVIDRVVGFQHELLKTDSDLKLVKPENTHLTLRFLGEIAPSMVTKISIELQKVRFKPFPIALAGAGFFPGRGRIRIIWIGVERGVSELLDIFNQIEERLSKLGFRREKRRFSPHITVARIRSLGDKAKLVEVIEKWAKDDFGSFTMRSVKLKKSLLTPRGPIYSTLYEIKGA